jgi:hypothetical protein
VLSLIRSFVGQSLRCIKIPSVKRCGDVSETVHGGRQHRMTGAYTARLSGTALVTGSTDAVPKDRYEQL